MNLWAVVPTRDRPELCAGLLADLARDGARVVLVDTGDNAWADPHVEARVGVDRDPPNISRWWNAGLDEVAHRIPPDEAYEVAVLNDDVRLPPAALDTLARELRAHQAAVAFPDAHSLLPAGTVDVLRRAEPHNLFHRMTGWCFLLAGEAGLRADEDLAWWYGDDDLEWRAALAGGVARVGGVTVDHRHPNESTNADPELGAQAGRDRATFAAKWGTTPW